MKINNKLKEQIEPYKEFKNGSKSIYTKTPRVYYTDKEKKEKVLVHGWYRFPSYDFLFGYPDKSSPRYKKEVCYFEYRDSRKDHKGFGIYLDVQEVNVMLRGFGIIANLGIENNNHLWAKFEEENPENQPKHPDQVCAEMLKNGYKTKK